METITGTDPTTNLPTKSNNQKDIRDKFNNFWRTFLNRPFDYRDPTHEKLRKKVLKSISDNPDTQLPACAARAVTIEEITSEQNIGEAIDALREDASPGIDGESASLYITYKKTHDTNPT